jgi:hypothetical protein
VRLEQVLGGLTAPVDLVAPGDGSGRLFLVEQGGRIRILEGGQLLPNPFLDLHQLVTCGASYCGERGLLGLAFAPDYATSRAFYVDYTNVDGDTVIARYRVAATDPRRAEPESAQVLLTIDQPADNHNGGHLAFGADGFLYVGMGDGGGGGDPNDNGQNRNSLLGKLLRIDVGGDGAYAVPADNPFVGVAGTRPEIWALGLRNPWRFSFDRATGDLFVGDVGQNLYEEVDFVPSAVGGGQNFGWRRMEASHCFSPASGCNDGTLTLPILEYDHDRGCSVTGGFRYRGSAIRELVGSYLYSDFCDGRIWAATPDAGGHWQTEVLVDSSLAVVSFAEDEAGELYIVGYGDGRSANGTLWRLRNAGATCTAQTLCLDGGRFAVSATWVNQYDGSHGNAVPVAYSDLTGYFTFGDPRNLELVVKVLDFGEAGGPIKVYYGQMTDLQFTLTVTEVATGDVRRYENTVGNCGGFDDAAFTFDAAPPGVAKSAGSCVGSATRLCLLDRRFAVEVDWANQFDGSGGNAQAAGLTDFAGLFTFTDPRNVEMVVKTLVFQDNGGADRILVLAGALSNLEYVMRVIDTSNGEVRSYLNPPGSYCGIIDADAF